MCFSPRLLLLYARRKWIIEVSQDLVGTEGEETSGNFEYCLEYEIRCTMETEGCTLLHLMVLRLSVEGIPGASKVNLEPRYTKIR